MRKIHAKKLSQMLVLSLFLAIGFYCLEEVHAQKKNSTSSETSQSAGYGSTIIIGVLLVSGIGLLGYTYFTVKKNRRLKQDEKYNLAYRNAHGIAHFYCGSYTSGLYPGTTARTMAYCLVNARDFVFVAGRNFDVIGTVARNKVVQISAQNHTVSYKQNSVLAILLLGWLGFLFRQTVTNERYVLILEWEDDNRIRQSAQFEFGNKGSLARMNEACNNFKRYFLPRV